MVERTWEFDVDEPLINRDYLMENLFSTVDKTNENKFKAKLENSEYLKITLCNNSGKYEVGVERKTADKDTLEQWNLKYDSILRDSPYPDGLKFTYESFKNKEKENVVKNLNKYMFGRYLHSFIQTILFAIITDIDRKIDNILDFNFAEY